MTRFAGMTHLDVWYTSVEVPDLLALMRKAEARKLEKNVVRKAQQATSMGALKKLTRSVDGERRITDAPPLVEHIPMRQDPTLVLRRYLRSLPADRRVLFSKYCAVDWARKVVGVGSVGTDDGVVLLVGDTESATRSSSRSRSCAVWSSLLPATVPTTMGRRVVEGQRLMQAAKRHLPRLDGDRRTRLLRSSAARHEGIDPWFDKLAPSELVDYARVCGAVRAHTLDLATRWQLRPIWAGWRGVCSPSDLPICGLVRRPDRERSQATARSGRVGRLKSLVRRGRPLRLSGDRGHRQTSALSRR